MLQNKIYQNFSYEILKNFITILFGLSIIALTARAVNFLDLIVDNGYPVITYFKYCILNLFGIAPKFFPLSFLLAITIFIVKHINDSEFVILWTSGVKKIYIINLFLFTSIIVLIFNLLLSTILTPFALNKSRLILGQDQLNSFFPTVRPQHFSDSFKGFTFIVEEKFKNELKHIFLYDTGNNLNKLSSNSANTVSTTIIAEKGIADQNKIMLFNGQIIGSKKNEIENEIIKFDQLNVDLGKLSTRTIKIPKIQETSTLNLFKCLLQKNVNLRFCNDDSYKEIIPTLIRRIILPLYVPVVTLICSFLLIKSDRIFLKRYSIFSYGFIILVISELLIRYTGLINFVAYLYISFPIILFFFLYTILIYLCSKETKKP